MPFRSTTTNRFRGRGSRKGGCEAIVRYSGVGSGIPPDSGEGWLTVSRCAALGDGGFGGSVVAWAFLPVPVVMVSCGKEGGDEGGPMALA